MRPPLIQSAPLLTRINVTPIIDVALVLVIILLITAPMMSVADLDVELPPARVRDAEQHGFISITLGADGSIAIDDDILHDVGEVAPFLHNRLEQRAGEDVYVVLRADAGLSHDAVRRVLDEARRGGAQNVGIATRQQGGQS